jgi:hypothetical protein
MADCIPFKSTGSREPTVRPRPIPRVVKAAIELMICGPADVEDGAAMNLVEAAKSVGMRPNTLRRYLNRPAIVQYIRVERRAFRQSLLAGNDAALKRVRDTSPNAMAVIASVRQIETMEEADNDAQRGGQGRMQVPGIIVVLNTALPQQPIRTTIEHEPPIQPDPDEPVRPRVQQSPKFIPPRRW